MKKFIITLQVVILTLFCAILYNKTAAALEENNNVFNYETNTSNYITFSSSVKSDFNILNINIEDFDGKIDPEIITFSNGYFNNTSGVPDGYYVYYYFPSIDNYSSFEFDDEMIFKAGTIAHNEYQKASYQNDGLKLYTSRLISGDSFYNGDTNFYVIKAFVNNFNDAYNLFESNKTIYIPCYEYSKIYNGNVSNYNFDDVEHFFEIHREIGLDSISWSCASVNNYWVEVKGVLGYFSYNTWDNQNLFTEKYLNDVLDNVPKVDYMHNDLDVYYSFFDIYKYGEKLDFSNKTKYITQIDYSITEYVIEKESIYRLKSFGINNWYLSNTKERRIKATETYTDIVRNEDYYITLNGKFGPTNLATLLIDRFDISSGNVVYKGIWKTSDANFEQDLKLMSGYDAKYFSNYSYACRVGLPEGYPRTKIKEKPSGRFPWQEKKYSVYELRYDIDVDFNKVYYMDHGVLYQLEIDKTNLVNIGFIGDTGDMHDVNIPRDTIPDINTKWNFWDYIKLILVIILLIPILKFIIWLFTRGTGGGIGLFRRGKTPYNKRKRVRIVEKKNGKKVTYINENVNSAGISGDKRSLLDVDKAGTVHNTYNITNTKEKNPVKKETVSAKKETVSTKKEKNYESTPLTDHQRKILNDFYSKIK